MRMGLAAKTITNTLATTMQRQSFTKSCFNFKVSSKNTNKRLGFANVAAEYELGVTFRLLLLWRGGRPQPLSFQDRDRIWQEMQKSLIPRPFCFVLNSSLLSLVA
jgi:hypothetical protein